MLDERVQFEYFEFQFHKGAIGVLTPKSFNTSYIEFQFHKGAIGVIERYEN